MTVDLGDRGRVSVGELFAELLGLAFQLNEIGSGSERAGWDARANGHDELLPAGAMRRSRSPVSACSGRKSSSTRNVVH
jgi:hypothetical protein